MDIYSILYILCTLGIIEKIFLQENSSLSGTA